MEIEGRSPIEWRESILAKINELYNHMLMGYPTKENAGFHRKIVWPAAKVADLMEMPGKDFGGANTARYHIMHEKYDREFFIKSILKMRFMKKHLRSIDMKIIENLNKDYHDRRHSICSYRYNNNTKKCSIQQTRQFTWYVDLISYMESEEQDEMFHIGLSLYKEPDSDVSLGVILIEIQPEKTH